MLSFNHSMHHLLRQCHDGDNRPHRCIIRAVPHRAVKVEFPGQPGSSSSWPGTVHHDRVRHRAAPNMCAKDQARPRRQQEHDVLALGLDLDDDEEPPINSIEQIGLHHCLEMIEVMVSEPPMDDPPHYLRISKLAAPSKFEGTDDANAFKVWLQELLEYLAMLRVTGPSFDRDHLRMMGSALSGSASRWFFSTVQSPQGRGEIGPLRPR
ncbi:hypothetical protein A0H81_14666 [Grifola frondosa]|uniref:Uncharacterized protein n=1 Tax=Grifola frondosa TaxID=5627 RepID=A0A1C7LKS1_GRIFR|nr:hypothetical protein A0H81_14666 [Grifola frondosa]